MNDLNNKFKEARAKYIDNSLKELEEKKDG